MPKQKTNKSIAKRFKVTGTGKIKRSKCGLRHLNSHMSGTQKRQLRNPGIVSGKLAAKYIEVMKGN
jgi:large subunit ribosomal protein L35